VENRNPDGQGTQNASALTDRFGRTLTYLRLAVTERCNLRCRYCMPESGIQLKPKDRILSYEELLRLVRIVVDMGVTKVRITGGEPMVRKDIMRFLQELSAMSGIQDLHMTTNGYWTEQQLQDLEGIRLAGVNFSLDTLKPERFLQITRRDAFKEVWKTLQALRERSIPLKINAVIQRGVNDDEILDLAHLAAENSLDVRFIEEMPFNGGFATDNPMVASEILAVLENQYPGMKQVSPEGSIATLYEIQGFQGHVGIIAGYTRSFCSACNRLRITSNGQLKNCLYEAGGVDLRELLRDGSSDAEIAETIGMAVKNKAKDGFEAEKLAPEPLNTSMSTIGG